VTDAKLISYPSLLRPGQLNQHFWDGAKIFVDGKWVTKASFQLQMGKGYPPPAKRLQVLRSGERIHFFLEWGTLYYREGIPTSEEDIWRSWEPVSEVKHDWMALFLDRKPAVFYCGGESPKEKIIGRRRTEKGWELFFSYPASFATEMGAYLLDEPGKFVLLLQSFPGAVRVIEGRGSKIEREIGYGRKSPFPPNFLSIMFIPYAGMLIMPLLLAFILSVQMRKYRVCEYVGGVAKVPFAPLWRRAVAQIIDAFFLGGPIIAGFILIMLEAADIENLLPSEHTLHTLPTFLNIGLVLGGIVWALVSLLIFSFLEGKWGRTPGKWVVGIQVLGTDLKPCGFGRAIVRNLLKFVDGFFNFTVGILVVAFTDDWQRVGDMAARTVVIRSG